MSGFNFLAVIIIERLSISFFVPTINATDSLIPASRRVSLSSGFALRNLPSSIKFLLATLFSSIKT